MSRTIFPLTTLTSLLVPFLCQGAEPLDESKEPPIKYVLQVGEKTIPIKEGESTSLPGTFMNPSIKLTADPFREFAYQDFRFKYPRAFTFEADLADADARNWTLSGNDFKLMLLSMNGELAAADFAQIMIDKFGRKNGKIINPNASLVLGGQTLKGTTIRITLADHAMSMDVYGIPSKGARSKMIVFQDNLDDAGNHSKECSAAIETLKTSWKVAR